MSDHETKEQVISKIRKLLRLAKSSNIHEAELAAEMASKLMEKWRVSAAAVTEIDDIRTGRDGVAAFEFVVPNCKMKLKWVETLGMACAMLFDGTILVNGRLHGTSWAWVGFRTEVPLMEELFLRLWENYPGIAEHDLVEAKQARRDTLIAQGVDAVVAKLSNFTPAETMKFKHGHGQGFALALWRRCDALAKARKVALQSVNTSTALVLVRDNALTEWKAKNHIRTVKRSQTQGDAGGFNSGYQRGNAIALGGALK